ncbi:hypothetical protein DFH29DRAFT_931494 [Suillus ampliporus]|nr:hypothetical protein DFH29DRAFT_931494 [Suillus ampliporus]
MVFALSFSAILCFTVPFFFGGTIDAGAGLSSNSSHHCRGCRSGWPETTSECIDILKSQLMSNIIDLVFHHFPDEYRISSRTIDVRISASGTT